MLCQGAQRPPRTLMVVYVSPCLSSAPSPTLPTCVNGPAPEQTGILVDVPAVLSSVLPWNLEDHLFLNSVHRRPSQLRVRPRMRSPQVWEKADFPFLPRHLAWIDPSWLPVTGHSASFRKGSRGLRF
uniref:Uncharacterized protein n=1 Tax=Mus musculus TaxID=10090 RepID=Q8C6U3_MOUSE|nr:unnamed protein product [Mus musculus]